MEGEQVIYDGRAVEKKFFRAYVYGLNDTRLLTKSWQDYISKISSGLWFQNASDVPEPVFEEIHIEEEKDTKVDMKSKAVKSKGKKKGGE